MDGKVCHAFVVVVSDGKHSFPLSGLVDRLVPRQMMVHRVMTRQDGRVVDLYGVVCHANIPVT